MRHDHLRAEIKKRLFAVPGELPVSRLGRLRRLGGTAFRGGKLALSKALRRRGDGELRAESLAAIVASVGELKGVTMKIGQILSYIDVALPAEARAALSTLQTHGQPMPLQQVHQILRDELGSAGAEIAEQMDEEPIAAASVGQVHRALLPDGTPVAVKVQYPGIDKAIRNDFGPAAIGGAVASVIYPGAKIESFVAEARARFLEECDYENEARRQQAFAQHYAAHPTIVIPEVHPDFCSPRVLTTTLMDGLHLHDYLATEPGQDERNRFGEALFEFYLGSLFRYQLYNCDPHPGNYLFGSDGKIAILDYGCTREFELEFVASLVGLTRAVHADDRQQLHQALIDVGIIGDTQTYDYATVRSLIRSFYGPMLRDESLVFESGAGMDMGEIIRGKRELLKLSLPGEFLFLLRIRFGLLSVLASLGARANWYRLECDYLEAVSPTIFDVVLMDGGSRTIQIIREIREATGLGLKASQDLLENGPQSVVLGLPKRDAESLRGKLEAAGATVQIRPAV